LVVLVTLTSLSLLVVAIVGTGVDPLVRAGTASIVAVYALGMMAAVRLLEPRTAGRRLAAVGLMVVFTGAYLAWPLGVAISALIYQRFASRRKRRQRNLK
jgi:amino acid efflux transporter